jgi:ubiquinone/menaquinone biosynthesis C-methylase UbiE
MSFRFSILEIEMTFFLKKFIQKMNNQQAYNQWAKNYDTVKNKTRDLEAHALRQIISTKNKIDILEIGCGTGKNTEFLQKIARKLVGADFSDEMLAKARTKITAENVEFRQLDLREKWPFENEKFDLITTSLVLEHIENLDHVFAEVHRVLRDSGQFYMGEYHPFKQYLGKKAQFETENGIFELECFVHHMADFFQTAKKNGFNCVDLKEWFDDENLENEPRILTLIFQK